MGESSVRGPVAVAAPAGADAAQKATWLRTAFNITIPVNGASTIAATAPARPATSAPANGASAPADGSAVAAQGAAFTKADLGGLAKELIDLIKRRDVITSAINKAAGKSASVEDVAKIGNTAERQTTAKAIQQALQPVDALVGDFASLVARLNDVQADKGRKYEGTSEAEVKTVWLKAQQERTRLRADIPAGLSSSEQGWAGKITAQLAPLASGDRAQLLTAAKSDVAGAQQAGNQLKGAVEKYQVRGMDRASTFFDGPRIGVAMVSEDNAQAMQATKALADKGRSILYNGGSYKELKAFMANAGVSEEFWPPELVESVQAWRKTQRAVNDERAQKLSAVQAGGKPTPSDVSEAWDYIASGVDADSTVKDVIGKSAIPSVVSDWVGTLNTFKTGGMSLFDFLKNPVEMVKSLSSDDGLKMKDALEKSVATLQSGISAAVDGANMAGQFGGDQILATVNKFVPGLSIASAGLDLAMAIKTLGEHAKTKSDTRKLQNQALGQFADGNTDEAMLGALRNEFSARKVQVAKDSVDVVTKAGDVAGAAAGTFGGAHSQIAATAITVAGGIISVGAKVVFKGIDWGKAKQAQVTLKQAQAGNMTAQIQVFEDSGFYAKMYIALLCRDDQALAKKFVVDRGIEEGDLDNVQGLKILRDNLLASAGQVDDTEVEGNLLKYMSGKAGDVAGKAAGAIAGAAAKVGNAARSLVTEDYDPKWEYGQDVPLTVAGWEAAKKAAIDAGLIDDASGITDALKKASPALAAADALAKAGGGAAEAGGRGRQQDKLTQGVAAVRAVLQALGGYAPQAFDGTKKVPHAGAAKLLRAMITTANQTEQGYWAALKKGGQFTENWVPPPIAEIKSAAWNAVWKAGVTACCLPSDDRGVGASLTAVEALAATWETLKSDPAKGVERQKHAVKYLTGLDTVKTKIDTALEIPEVNAQPLLVKAIGDFTLLINAKQRDLDAYQSGQGQGGAASWAAAPTLDFSKDQFTAEWKKMWDKAGADGFRDPSLADAGLAEALKGFEASVTVLVAARTPGSALDPQDRLKAYADIKTQAGAVRQSASQLMRLHRYSAEQLKQGADQAAVAALARAETLSQSKREIPFKAADTIDEKGWKATYKAALDAGAILKSGTAESALADILKDRDSTKTEYEKQAKKSPVAPKDCLLKSATRYRAKLRGVVDVVAMVRGLKGYGDHSVMRAYLDKVRASVDAPLADAELNAAADGASAKLPPFKPATAKGLDADEWGKNKDAAVKAGIVPDKKTGVGDAIKSFLKTDAALQKDRQKPAAGQDKKLAEKHGKEVTALHVLLSSAGDESKNPAWTGYVAGLVKAVEAKRVVG